MHGLILPLEYLQQFFIGGKQYLYFLTQFFPILKGPVVCHPQYKKLEWEAILGVQSWWSRGWVPGWIAGEKVPTR